MVDFPPAFRRFLPHARSPAPLVSGAPAQFGHSAFTNCSHRLSCTRGNFSGGNSMVNSLAAPFGARRTTTCHPGRGEGSHVVECQIFRFAQNDSDRAAFTLVELLVVIAIIG